MALGFAIFLFFFGMAFWILLFLSGFIGLWVHWGIIDIIKANLAKRGIITIDEFESQTFEKNGFKKILLEKTEVEIQTLNKSNPLEKSKLPREQTHQISTLKKSSNYYSFGLSVQGKSHKKDVPIPCQDSHKLGSYKDLYHYAIVSDGAGSAENSHIGSKIACENLEKQLLSLFINNDFFDENNSISPSSWQQLGFDLFKTTRDEMIKFSKKNKLNLNTLKCTLLLVIQTPFGILSANVGDGRAGCLAKGNYYSLMVPFQTFVVGSTIFLTKENWNSFFRTSIHNILEPEAFFAISDGCDDFSFLLKGPVPESEKGVYDKVYSEARYDHNQPFPGFYDALINQMKELITINEEQKVVSTAEEIIDLGVFKGKSIEGIQKEDDDKTLVLFFK